MFILYDLIFTIIAIIYFPVYLFKGKFHAGFLSRLGFIPKGLSLNRPVWIHAVSVGEAMAVRGLVEGLRKAYPERKFVISTVTPTGNKVAFGAAKEGDFVTYLPLDISFVVRSIIKRIKPSLFIIAETEIWPNLIQCLYKNKIPIVTVNGRLSDASFKGYLSIKFLVKAILEKISLFCVQTSRDKERLMRLGVGGEEIKVTGNMKFDAAKICAKIHDPADLRAQMDFHPEDKILVAGSTHPQEDEIILAVYKDLLSEFHGLKLIIAPRHPERSREISKIASRFGFRSAMASGFPFKCDDCIESPVFIVDIIGRLFNFYSIADIVFVGGSLVKKGGQNILEPASLSKPVIFGPFMFNFRDIADLFLSNDAAVMVRGQQELKRSIAYFLNNFTRALEMGERAKQLTLQNQGATGKTIEWIKELLLNYS